MSHDTVTKQTLSYRRTENSESGKGYLLMSKSSRVLALCVALLVAGFSGSAFGGKKPKKEKKPGATAKPAAATLEALEETIADLKAQLDELKAQVRSGSASNATVDAAAGRRQTARFLTRRLVVLRVFRRSTRLHHPPLHKLWLQRIRCN